MVWYIDLCQTVISDLFDWQRCRETNVVCEYYVNADPFKLQDLFFSFL